MNEETHDLDRTLRAYLRDQESLNRLTRASLAHYESEIRLLFRYLATPQQTDALRQHLSSVAPATASRKLIIWKAFLKTCPSPWNEALDDIPLPKIRRKQPLFLTEEESFRLEQSCFRSPDVHRDRLFVALALQLGLRLSEMLKLKFSDFQEGWVRILRKGEKEQRLPVSAGLQTLLRHWKDESLSADQDWIFPGVFRASGRDPLSPRAAQLLVTRLRKLAGIDKKISPHSLRHTFATRMAAHGANLVALKEILGHERLTTTERYLHVTPTHLKEALSLLHRPRST